LKPCSARSLVVLGLWLLAATTLVGTPSGISVWGTVRVGDRVEQNAVVWLDAPAGAPDPPRQQAVVLDQRNQTFYPHVLAVRVGTRVDLPNNDRVFHNVFSFHNGKRFDLGLYPVGTSRQVTFDQPGLSRIFCNIHPNMAAYVIAVDTPYFAVSDSMGRLQLASVPPGSYTYHAWRPGGPDLSGVARVQLGTSLDIRWP
jgi:plastocyanin